MEDSNKKNTALCGVVSTPEIILTKTSAKALKRIERSWTNEANVRNVDFKDLVHEKFASGMERIRKEFLNEVIQCGSDIRHDEAIYQLNIKRLNENALNFIWVSEDANFPLLDVSIKHISGRLIVEGVVPREKLYDWLDENIEKAICIWKNRSF